MRREFKSMVERTRRVVVRFSGWTKPGLARSRLIGLVAIVAIGSGVSVFLVEARSNRASATGVETESRRPNFGPRPMTSRTASTSETVPSLVVTLRPHGFEPSQVTLPHKKILLVVENRSGLSEMSLRLDREAGDKVHEVRRSHTTPDWSNIMDLPPGRYILRETTNPNFTCTITVTPR